MFSKKVQIPPSATVTINTIAQQKRKSGQRVYNLSAGEPMMDMAHYLRDAVDVAIDQGQTLYPPVAGLDDLRSAASEWINSTYGTNYTSAQTLITCGGKFGIYLAFQALLNDGDEVMMIAPYWVSYPSMVELFGGVPVVVETEEHQGWRVDLASLERAVTSKTKVLILNNASNPTGTLYTRDELVQILDFAKRHNIIVLSDEVYSGLTYEGEYVSCGSFPEYAESVIVIQSCSKNFGMTGWRVGFVFAPQSIIKMLTTLQGQSITGTSIVSQWAAIAALKSAATITQQIHDEMRSRRDIFIGTLNELFGCSVAAPASAFYSFIPLTAFGITETDDVAFCERVLDKSGVAMVPGSAFGKPSFVRCSFGERPQELRDSLKALKAYLISSL